MKKNTIKRDTTQMLAEFHSGFGSFNEEGVLFDIKRAPYGRGWVATSRKTGTAYPVMTGDLRDGRIWTIIGQWQEV